MIHCLVRGVCLSNNFDQEGRIMQEKYNASGPLCKGEQSLEEKAIWWTLPNTGTTYALGTSTVGWNNNEANTSKPLVFYRILAFQSSFSTCEMGIIYFHLKGGKERVRGIYRFPQVYTACWSIMETRKNPDFVIPRATLPPLWERDCFSQMLGHTDEGSVGICIKWNK